MEGSNRVEPLMKSEDELKRGPFSVRAGALSKKLVGLRNRSRKRVKRVKVLLTLEESYFCCFLDGFAAAFAVKNPSLLLEMRWWW